MPERSADGNSKSGGENSGSLRRFEFLDALRGLCCLLMVCYHHCYNLGMAGILSWNEVFSFPIILLQLVSSRGFILIAGVSSRLSRSNIRRGFLLIGCSAVVTIVSLWFGTPIWFGILHFLGSSMLIYGLSDKFLRSVNEYVKASICIVLFVLTKFWLEDASAVEQWYLFPIGLITSGFSSADYYPIFPWIFLYLLGTCMGAPLVELRGRPYIESDRRIWQFAPLRFLRFIGRHSLAVYLLHQPILQLLLYFLT